MTEKQTTRPAARRASGRTYSTRGRSGATSRPARPARSGRTETTKRFSAPRSKMKMRRPRREPLVRRKREEYYPAAPEADTVRILPLGGVEEVGRNMTTIEANGDIFIFDVGFQFVSDESSPGIDYVLPNIKYLEKNKDRIRGIVITHGHLDHVGGIPFLLERLGNPPMYTQQLTSLIIKKRQDEFPDAPKADLHIVKPGDRIQIGNTFVKFFPVTHSIPDSMGTSIETPQGNVVITGDLKLDHTDGEPSDKEKKIWKEVGESNNVFFIADSTNAEQSGFSMSEKKVHQTLEDIIKTVNGRLIIGTFASQFERMVEIIKIADRLGKKIVAEGRSIKTNIEIAERIGMLEAQNSVFIPASEIDEYSPDKIIIIGTGAQGEQHAALMRIATGKHKYIKLSSRDTIVFSSSVIPGNEMAVQTLKDNLYRHDITLINYRTSDVHSTGHGNQGELVWINKQVGAKYFMPAYGYHSMLRCHARAVEQSGFPKENIVIPDNGTVIDIKGNAELFVHKKKAPADPTLVDGFAIGDMQEVVVRDRKMLASDGMFVVIATLVLKTGRLKKSPDIISRGFVYLRESQDVLHQARILIKKTVEDDARGMHPVDLDYIKKNLTNVLEGYLFQKTNKNPLVIPVIIGV